MANLFRCGNNQNSNLGKVKEVSFCHYWANSHSANIIVKKDGTILSGQSASGDYLQTYYSDTSGAGYIKALVDCTCNVLSGNTFVNNKSVKAGETIITTTAYIDSYVVEVI